MESKNVNYLVMAFVLLIIGSALIGTIASNTNGITSKDRVYNESKDLVALGCIQAEIDGGQINGTDDANCNVSVSNAPSGWEIYDTDSCPTSSVIVMNSTGFIFAEGTDYNEFLDIGVIQMLNSSDTQEGFANTTLTTYAHCGDGYLNSSWGRTVLSLVAGFIALALLGGSLWLFYSVWNSLGINS